MLWEHVQPSQNLSIYNGGVEAVSNLFGKQYHIKVSSAEYKLGKGNNRPIVVVTIWLYDYKEEMTWQLLAIDLKPIFSVLIRLSSLPQ